MAGQFNYDIWKQYMDPSINFANNLTSSSVGNSMYGINPTNLNVDRDSKIAATNSLNLASKDPKVVAAIARAKSGEAPASTTSNVANILQNMGDALFNAGNSNNGHMVGNYYVPRSGLSANTLKAVGDALGTSMDQINGQNSQIAQDNSLAKMYDDAGAGTVEQNNKDFDNKKDLLNTQISGEGNNQLNLADTQNTGKLQNTYLDNTMKGNNAIELANLTSKVKANQPLSPLEQEKYKALKFKNDANDKELQQKQIAIEDNKKELFRMMGMLHGIDSKLLGMGDTDLVRRSVGNHIYTSGMQQIQDYQNSLDQSLPERISFMTGNKTEKELELVKEMGFNQKSTKEQNLQNLINLGRKMGLKNEDMLAYWNTLETKANNAGAGNNNEQQKNNYANNILNQYRGQ